MAYLGEGGYRTLWQTKFLNHRKKYEKLVWSPLALCEPTKIWSLYETLPSSFDRPTDLALLTILSKLKVLTLLTMHWHNFVDNGSRFLACFLRLQAASCRPQFPARVRVWRPWYLAIPSGWNPFPLVVSPPPSSIPHSRSAAPSLDRLLGAGRCPTLSVADRSEYNRKKKWILIEGNEY